MRKVYRLSLFVFLLAIFLLFQNNNSLAQDTGTLRGLVTDSTTAEALPFASAYIKELKIGANTDTRGYFLITSVPSNQNYTLIVSYVGYRSQTLTIRVLKEKLSHYNFNLVPANIQMKTIESVGERVNATSDSKISVYRISARELELIPKGVETDIFRSIQYLPGVQSTGDISAQYYVRGGASNQNLVLIDGITIYYPFHAMGLFGVVDPDMINNIEFYKGGFTAEYGERLSSVMSIVSKDGNKNNYGATASGSLMSAKLLLEGPIPNGSFIVTGRKSYSNNIIKKFLDDRQVPIDFYDFSFKANYANPDFISGSKFSVNGFFNSDNINNKDPQIENYNWRNNVYGFKWFQVGKNSPLFLELGITVSNFEGHLDPKFSSAQAMSNSVKDVGIQMNFTYILNNKDEVGVGYHINLVKTNLFLQNSLNISKDLGSEGSNISLYAKYKFLQWDFLGLDVGTRMNIATLSANKNIQSFEPRINIAWYLTPRITVKAAWGIYQQAMTTISDENNVRNVFEPWVITPSYLAPAKSNHYVLGIVTELFNNFSLSVEGYYKTVENLPLLNEQKVFFTDPDFIDGKGESYGLEFYTKINPNPISFTASYTYAFAYKEVNGLRYYPRYDIRHKLNLACVVNLGAGWSTSVDWIYASGLPFTQLLGYYDKYYFQNIFSPWNGLDQRMPYLILDTQNLGRLPDYHRLDFTISRKFKIDPITFNVDLNIINVYDRKNIFYFKRDTGERINMLPFLPSVNIKVEL